MNCPKCRAENPETAHFCLDCGTALAPPSAAPTPEQPAVTETIATPIRELTTGSIYADRYQVIEELGKGGMGRVYKVFDTAIKEKVALKLMRPEIASDKETIERFSSEIRLARKISHRNVCRTYDLGKAEGTNFITMEYVSGENLKSMLHMMGQLSPGQIVSLGKQICDGLAEAHSLGVVHRDLKPQNIMIDRSGNAKIMDFGIARSIREKGITGPSVLIGTPEYMSPEQAEAKEVDRRSDLYSLGIIMYELATGRVPFEGETALSIAMKHKGEAPKNPKELNSQIPDGLSSLIMKCLEKDMAKRYQTATELRSELENIEKGIPTTELVVPKPKPVTSKEITIKFSAKNLLVPVSIGIAVVIGALAIWKIVFKKPIALLPEQKRSIAVISFENQTGDKAYDYLTKVIPNLLITSLEQSGYFNVTTWERIYDLLKQVGKPDAEFINRDLGFELCQKDGVEVIVLGSVTKAGNTFVMDAKVLDVGTKNLLGTANSQGDSPDSILKNQVDDLSRQIAKGAGLSERKFAAATKRIGELTTNSLEAYNCYIKGAEEGSKHKPAQARQYFEKAVELDPSFAMALQVLGGESLKKAMALSKNVTEKERLYIQASYARVIDNNIPKAVSIYRQIVNKYPKEKGPYFFLGSYAENPREGIEMLRKALEIDPNWGPALNIIGYYFLTLGQKENAVEAFNNYLSIRPGDANPLDSLADAYFQSGQLNEAVETYNKALRIDPSFSSSMLAMGYIAAIREDYSQAYEWVERAIRASVGLDKPWPYLWKAFYHSWLGSYEKCFSNIQVAEDLSEASNFKSGAALASWLRAWVYYDKRDFELSRKYNESSIEHLIGLGSGPTDFESYHRAGYNFLSGLIDIQEKKAESAKSRLTEMNSLTAGFGWSWSQKDMAIFETEWLRNIILLHEKSSEKALDSWQKSAVPKFVPSWIHSDFQKFRYNTPFQRDVLAMAFAERGEIDRAITEYEKLITFDPSKPARLLIHPLYHYRLARLYEQKGLKDKAKAQYERFLNIWKDADPGRPEVEDAESKLARWSTLGGQ